MSWLMLFRAEQRLSSSLSGLFIAMVPFISVALSKALGDREPLGAARGTGLALGLAGVVIIVGVEVHGTELLAVAEIVVTAVSYAVGPMIIFRHLRGIPALGVVTASLALTAVVYAPFALTHLPTKMSGEVLSSIVVLCVVCTAMAFLAFFALVSEVGPDRATVVTFVNPAVAVLLGVLLLKEPFTLGIGLGFPLVFLGSYLATREGPGASSSRLYAQRQMEPLLTPLRRKLRRLATNTSVVANLRLQEPLIARHIRSEVRDRQAGRAHGDKGR